MEDVLCNDDATFRYMNDSNLGCEWVKRNEKICNLQWQNKLVSQFCSDSCNVCDSAETCFDDLNFRFMHIEGLSCEWVGLDKQERCILYGDQIYIANMCPRTCGICDIFPSSYPSTNPSNKPSVSPTSKSSRCIDDPSFTFFDDPNLDCGFVGKDPLIRCEYNMLNGSVKQLCPESCNMCEKKSESNLFGKIQIKKFNENSLVSEKKLNVPSNTTSAPTLQKAQIDENLQPQQNYGDTILSLDETSEKDPNMKDISGINNTKQIDKKKDEVCVDEVEFSFGAVPDLNCHWVREDKLKRCNLVFQNTAIAGKCPLTCGICSEANARNLSRLSWLKNPYAMIVLGNLLGMLCALFISSTRYCKKRRGLILNDPSNRNNQVKAESAVVSTKANVPKRGLPETVSIAVTISKEADNKNGDDTASTLSCGSNSSRVWNCSGEEEGNCSGAKSAPPTVDVNSIIHAVFKTDLDAKGQPAKPSESTSAAKKPAIDQEYCREDEKKGNYSDRNGENSSNFGTSVVQTPPETQLPCASDLKMKTTTETSSKSDTAETSEIPTLEKWKKNPNGTLTGYITGSSNYDRSSRVTTSRIKWGLIKSGEVVQTRSGTSYFLK